MASLATDFLYDSSLDSFILELFREGASHTRVAVELGLTRTQYNSVREANPIFDRLCEYGENLAEVALEELALQGAKGQIKNFNNTILKFLMESRHGETYASKKQEKAEENTLLEQLMAGSPSIVDNSE